MNLIILHKLLKGLLNLSSYLFYKAKPYNEQQATVPPKCSSTKR